ncbi:hypothetical protein SAMN02745172_03747 [Pseudoxanthobacter soli DSM 19599]|uniref:Uncharacterized protein n=1 Tax=Pseudoxanthobacter soli DSM 19599 TaxID=1123029 RepID=A0A1M7ZQ92_9HYPH|nr:hypothetical protein [Pseudoxanthobacter soli]SHO67083.1 hypothetical protein SAMN02745172_03747 [Pseudoxanthobacter soli DSM 19599]
MDEVRYREYKILLRAEKFFASTQFEVFWDLVCQIAKKSDVGVHTNKDAFHRLVREVLFYDTPNFDLYRNAFILRKRTFYEDGWPRNDHELTVKFRHADLGRASKVDMTPHLNGIAEIKFKEEILPLKDQLGGMRSLYSHNCVLNSPNIVLTQGLDHISAVFPPMGLIDLSPETEIHLVNNVAVEEIQVDAGVFDFGHGLTAKATVAIWRNRASEVSLIGEFAFQAKFEHYSDLHKKAKERSEHFYRAIQMNAPEWVALGTTKTAMVYGIGNTVVVHNE